MTDSYSTRNHQQRIIKDTDQTERVAILSGSATLDAGVFDDKIAGALDDFDPLNTEVIHEDWHEEDLKYDSAVGAIHEEVDRRISLLGEHYPFKIEGSQIQYSSSESGFYEFCLAIVCAPTITKGEYVHLPRDFEKITALLVELYFGIYSSHLHVGTPREKAVGTTFYEAMQTLSKGTNEWIWGPHDGLPNPHTMAGDDGLDFVVWKDTLDDRHGKLFVLGQCACGANWGQKFDDINLNSLSKWFNPMSYVDPVRAFVTPHHLSEGHLTETTLQAGMVFDRARLVRLAQDHVSEKRYSDWINRLNELSGLVLLDGTE